MQPAAVEVTGLVKRYRRTVAVDGVTFAAARNQITALLGPNGAGKTTTVETCEGFRRPDGGTVRVLGLDPWRDRRRLRPRVGVMLQAGGIYPGARVAEVVELFAAFAGRPHPPDRLLHRLGLAGVAGRPVRRLSGGERQRLALALAVVGRPELVFLDEPTAGLDPQGRLDTWALVAALRDGGASVLLTTHLLEEAERLADRVVIVAAGRVVAAGSPAQLTAGAGRVVRFTAAPRLPLADLLAVLPAGTTAAEGPPGRYRLHGPADPASVAAVTAWCAQRGVLVADLRVGGSSLEEVFLSLTGTGER